MEIRRARDRIAARVFIGGWEEQRVLSIGQRVEHAADRGREQRTAERRCFDQNIWEAVVVRRQNDPIRGEVIRQQIESIDRRHV